MTDIADPALQGFTPKAASEDLETAELDLLSHLGAGVLSTWDRLPRDIQRTIFEAAVKTDPQDAQRLRTDIALFLHEYGNDHKTGQAPAI